MPQKSLLCYGHYLEPYWCKNIVLPQLHALAECGWRVDFYYSKRYLAHEVIEKEYLPNNPSSKINFIPAKSDFPVDIQQRQYTHEQTRLLADFLSRELPGVNPDIILNRGPSAPYLSAAFPRAKVVNIMEGHLPFFNSGHEFLLFPGNELWGVPYFDQHRKTILKRLKTPGNISTKIDRMRREIVKKAANVALADYCRKLRQKYSKLILFPFEGLHPVVHYATQHHTLTGNQDQNLLHLIKNAPPDWAFLATFHPNEMKKDLYAPFYAPLLEYMDKSRELSRLHTNLFFPQYDLGQLPITHSLTSLCDAVAVQTGKTLFAAAFMEKPIIQLGHFSLEFYRPISPDQNMPHALKAFRPPPRSLLNTFFYWLITSYKHPSERICAPFYYFKNILERAADPQVAEGRLYEWATPQLQSHIFEEVYQRIMSPLAKSDAYMKS